MQSAAVVGIKADPGACQTDGALIAINANDRHDEAILQTDASGLVQNALFGRTMRPIPIHLRPDERLGRSPRVPGQRVGLIEKLKIMLAEFIGPGANELQRSADERQLADGHFGETKPARMLEKEIANRAVVLQIDDLLDEFQRDFCCFMRTHQRISPRGHYPFTDLSTTRRLG